MGEENVIWTGYDVCLFNGFRRLPSEKKTRFRVCYHMFYNILAEPEG